MKKLFDQIDWTATGLIVRLIAIWTMGLLVGATIKPAEVRAKGPKARPTPVQPPELPGGIRRDYLDGHLYYWRSPAWNESSHQPILIHAAGCTNHAPCAQTVLQLEK